MTDEEQVLIQQAQDPDCSNEDIETIRRKLVKDFGWGRAKARRLGNRETTS